MRSALPLALALALGLPALAPAPVAAQQDPIGLRLLVQPWDPATDDDTVLFPLDEPALLSDGLVEAWSRIGPVVHDLIVAEIGKPDLVASGVTLYEIDLRIPPPRFELAYLGGGGRTALEMRLTARLRDIYLELTSTTPTVAGTWGDPRCSARADLSVSLRLELGPDLQSPLRVRADPDQAIDVANFDFDSQNLPCDVINAAVGLVGAERIIAQVLEGPGLERPLAHAMAENVDPVSDRVNERIAALVPPGLGVMNAWLAPQAGGGQLIALYLGLQAPLPDPSPPATIAGRLSFAQSALAQGFDCARLPLAIDRKTGPRPVLNPSGTLGDPPLERLAVTVTCDAPAGDGSREVRIAGLSSAFPNYVTQTGLSGSCQAGATSKTGLLLDTGTWPSEGPILSRALGGRYDIAIDQLEVPCPVEYEAERQPGDEGIGVNPTDFGSWLGADPGLGGDRWGGDLGRTGGLQSLNPQPLPPGGLVENLRRQVELQNELLRLQAEQLRLQQFGLGR